MMQQMKLYTCFLTENSDVVIVLPFIGENEPDSPKIVYDGGEHAIFKKSEKEDFVLDFLNEMVRPVLKQSQKALVFEIDVEKQEIVRDYFVPVEHSSIKLNVQVERP